MSITYNITTNFGAKDNLPSNDPNKVIRGSEHTVEFTAIQTAFQLAAPVASPTFTGVATSPSFVGALTGDVVGNVTGDITGNADSADQWSTARTITFTGDATGTVDIDGSGNVSCALTSTGSSYVHPSYVTTNINTSGAEVIDVINTTDEGHISSMSKRTMTLADLGYTGDPAGNNYVHPTHPGDDINLDTGALTGATVISDLDFNVTSDTLGHVTDANATIATRSLTLNDLGYTGASNANFYVHPTGSGDKHVPSGGAADQYLKYSANGTAIWSDLPEGSSYTHPINDTANINTSGSTVVDQIQTNTEGHITFMNTRTLTAGDLGALKDTTDTFTGTLSVTGSVVATGNITAYSDARLKTDVGACMGLSAVEAMNGYNYTMNEEICAGVIAQELEEVAPELVIDNVDGFKSVNYMGLTAYLIEAVKDLSAKVKELEEK
jgi:hypothetical protein